MKKYISEIIYDPQEIGIKLIYKDFSVEDADILNVNNPLNITNPNDAECGGAKRAGANNNKSFSDFLKDEYEKMVVYLPLQTYFMPLDNIVHKYRDKILSEQLRAGKMMEIMPSC